MSSPVRRLVARCTRRGRFKDGLRSNRARYAAMLSGDGIEIGPLSSPSVLPPGSTVRYVDKFDLEELRRRNPDIAPESIVRPDIICDSRRLEPIPDVSVDFVIASHVLEHVDNPIAALLEWRRVLRPRGRLLLVVPDGRFTFDRGRPFTTLDHLLWDYVNDGTQLKQLADLFHVAECNLNMHESLDVPGAVELGRTILGTTYESHFHVWSYEAFNSQLEALIDRYGLPFSIVAGAADECFEMVFVLEAANGTFSIPERTVPAAAH